MRARDIGKSLLPFARALTSLPTVACDRDTEVLPSMDAIVEIPMFGEKNSLNIASCAAVVLYDVVRQRTEAARSNEELT